uniref:Uncharacterized protein n=1 Tax=viral metagenome TaxID=1070528 RepID=A0A6C0CQW6_9ZZZZ
MSSYSFSDYNINPISNIHAYSFDRATPILAREKGLDNDTMYEYNAQLHNPTTSTYQDAVHYTSSERQFGFTQDRQKGPNAGVGLLNQEKKEDQNVAFYLYNATLPFSVKTPPYTMSGNLKINMFTSDTLGTPESTRHNPPSSDAKRQYRDMERQSSTLMSPSTALDITQTTRGFGQVNTPIHAILPNRGDYILSRDNDLQDTAIFDYLFTSPLMTSETVLKDAKTIASEDRHYGFPKLPKGENYVRGLMETINRDPNNEAIESYLFASTLPTQTREHSLQNVLGSNIKSLGLSVKETPDATRLRRTELNTTAATNTNYDNYVFQNVENVSKNGFTHPRDITNTYGSKDWRYSTARRSENKLIDETKYVIFTPGSRPAPQQLWKYPIGELTTRITPGEAVTTTASLTENVVSSVVIPPLPVPLTPVENPIVTSTTRMSRLDASTDKVSLNDILGYQKLTSQYNTSSVSYVTGQTSNASATPVLTADQIAYQKLLDSYKLNPTSTNTDASVSNASVGSVSLTADQLAYITLLNSYKSTSTPTATAVVNAVPTVVTPTLTPDQLAYQTLLNSYAHSPDSSIPAGVTPKIDTPKTAAENAAASSVSLTADQLAYQTLLAQYKAGSFSAPQIDHFTNCTHCNCVMPKKKKHRHPR